MAGGVDHRLVREGPAVGAGEKGRVFDEAPVGEEGFSIR